MIHRPGGYALRDEGELRKRLNRPYTVQLLRQLGYMYDAQQRRIRNGESVISGFELTEFKELMKVTERWLRVIVIDFGVDHENKSGSNANGDGSDSRPEGNLSKAERRRRRRQERARSLNGICGSP